MTDWLANWHDPANVTARAHKNLGRATERALEAEAAMRNLTGAALIDTALAAICDSQAELGRLSGLTQNTLRALKAGKKPTAAQRAALCWAVLKRWA